MKDTRRIKLLSGAAIGPSCRHVFLCALCVSVVNASAAEFASEVIEYRPAPGQFVNNPLFNDPAKALGAPVGAGLNAQDTTKVVSLGGFGGSITLGFEQTVMDDPLNAWGLDAIVYGNAFYASSNPNGRFAEAATIEISRDVNGNGVADDAWYVVRGSHLPFAAGGAQQIQAWDSNAGTPTPPVNIAWYPSQTFYPGWPAMYSTMAMRLPSFFEAPVVVNPNGLAAALEGFHGYAECTPVLILGDTDADDAVEAPGMSAEEFYTAADNPFVVGVSAGSGGGDAIDVAWAVDAVTGAAANLDGFDFMRITTAVNRVDMVLGEMSAEIGGVADARARALFFDVNVDGRVDVEDVYAWERAPVDLTGEATVNGADRGLLVRAARANEVEDASQR